MGKSCLLLCVLSLLLTQQTFAQTDDTSTKIAFVSTRDGSAEIYLMNADGSDVERLTNNDLDETSLSWSPDGTQLAFVSQLPDWSYQIFVMDADGSNLRQLTDAVGYNLRPSWSPDGTRIAFEAQRSTQHDIFVIDADSSNETNLTNSVDANEHCPEWSPDGTRMIFGSDRGFESTRGVPDFIIFYTMQADGTDVIVLPNGGDVVSCFAWSPDGTQIAYSASSGIDRELYLMDANGTVISSPTEPIETIENIGTPAWSTDGQQLVFAAQHRGNVDIYVINADGTALTNLTQHQAHDSEPAWQP